MKNKISLLVGAACLAMLSGCVSVPANRIEIQGPTGSYTIKTPKNVLIENFKASIPTNGAIQIEFTKWSSTNDAGVIDKTALGQAELVKQWGVIITNAAAIGAAAARQAVAP
jgi:hypothetical protein